VSAIFSPVIDDGFDHFGSSHHNIDGSAIPTEMLDAPGFVQATNYHFASFGGYRDFCPGGNISHGLDLPDCAVDGIRRGVRDTQTASFGCLDLPAARFVENDRLEPFFACQAEKLPEPPGFL
jgi:hypothetical protein